jgi:cyclopropane fatty-acyl-phospholipid synthase-like methyltransferase
MSDKRADLAARLTREQYPRSAAYDPVWVLERLMGPNVLWLTEALSRGMQLAPGSRVLDLGCGRAVSSVFLAREFDLQVWATDLWIAATTNWETVTGAGEAARVFPIHAEAHALPFADGFFDALVSMDAYHYFGTDDLYLGYVARLVRPGGQIGIVVPGLREEFTAGVPEYLLPYWEADFWSFHSPAWWRSHWEKSGRVEVLSADFVPDGGEQWRTWLEVCEAHGYGYPAVAREAEMLRVDAGRNLGFTRVVARKLESAPGSVAP